MLPNNNKKGIGKIVEFAVPVDDRVKIKENEKRDEYLDFARELKKATDHESGGDNNCNRYARNNPQRLGKKVRRIKNQRSSGDQPDYNIIKICQNT